MELPKLDGLFDSIERLSPQSGDLLVFRSGPEDQDGVFVAAVAVKQKLAEQGIRPVIVSLSPDIDVSTLPRDAFTEQGYVWRSDVRDWLEKSVPLGKQAPILRLFDERFGTLDA